MKRLTLRLPINGQSLTNWLVANLSFSAFNLFNAQLVEVSLPITFLSVTYGHKDVEVAVPKTNVEVSI